jgi:hypothetical protein
MDALLYLPEHAPEQTSARHSALSEGWRGSFLAIRKPRRAKPRARETADSASPSVRRLMAGLRPLRVSRIERESASVVSLMLKPADSRPLVAACPASSLSCAYNQKPNGPVLLRNYCFQICPCRPLPGEYHGGERRRQYLLAQSSQVGHCRWRRRGEFTLQPGEKQVVLLSAGVGAIPVLAMLHSLLRKFRPAKSGGCSEPVTAGSRVCGGVTQFSATARQSFIAYSRPGPRSSGRGLRCFRTYHSRSARKLVCRATPISICGGPRSFCGFEYGLMTGAFQTTGVHGDIRPRKTDNARCRSSHAAPHPPEACGSTTSVACAQRPQMC